MRLYRRRTLLSLLLYAWEPTVEGLAATKEIVAAIRAGTKGREPEAYGAALRTGAAARDHIRAFAARRPRS
jgi:hypothetical protein